MSTGYKRIYINGVLRTDYVINGSITISDELNSKINTCSFKTYKDDGVFTPTYGNEVIVYDHNDVKIFGGRITQASEQRAGLIPGTNNELLTYSINCQDYTKDFQRKIVVETYHNSTPLAIIQDILVKYFPLDSFTTTNFETGPVITQISFNYKSADKVLDDLAKSIGFQWFIDYDKDIHFFDYALVSSTYTIDATTTNWSNLNITPDVSQLRNRIYIRGGIYYSDLYTESIQADGVQKDFLLAYTPGPDNFAVTISSVSKTVGLNNIDDADYYDFMLDRKEKTIKMGNSTWAQANTPLTFATVLVVDYEYEIPVLTVQEDTQSIETIKALNGGDGIYEYLIVDENITSTTAARERAAAELADYANAIVTGTFDSYDASGLKSGDIIHIDLPDRGINSDYLVQTVKIKEINKDTFKYSINFSGKLYGLVDVLIALFKRSQTIVIGKDETLDAFNHYTDFTDGSLDRTPTLTLKTPPFAWSNDAGTTTNKMMWGLFQWA